MTLVDSTNCRTIADVYAAVGEKVCARWQALGETDSKIHWQYGAEADAIIPEFPAMLVYKAIAKKAGRSSQTIRKAYYTYKAFDEATREKYHLVPYSIFQHAAGQNDPIAVLEHYVNNQASVDEVEAVFPEVVDEGIFDEFKKTGLDRGMFYGIYREAWGMRIETRAKIMDLLNKIDELIKKENPK